MSIFAKSSIPENSWIEANHVSLNASIVHEGGKRLFEKLLILRGVRIGFFALLQYGPILHVSVHFSSGSRGIQDFSSWFSSKFRAVFPKANATKSTRFIRPYEGNAMNLGYDELLRAGLVIIQC